jgi:hypothetical protein
VMGTVLLTGLEMTRMLALGQCSATDLARSRTMEALVLNRSWKLVSLVFCDHLFASHIHVPSRVMPGLRGTPAGMRTISAPVRAALMPPLAESGS